MMFYKNEMWLVSSYTAWIAEYTFYMLSVLPTALWICQGGSIAENTVTLDVEYLLVNESEGSL
jgi:hypothetical protein